MFEEFGTKYETYLMQIVTVNGVEYLMKRDGTVYTRATDLPVVEDKDVVKAVQKQAAKDGGWNV